MLGRGLRVKNMVYTSLFDSCANCPYPEKGLIFAQRLREKLAEKQIILNEINYNSMIKGELIPLSNVQFATNIFPKKKKKFATSSSYRCYFCSYD